MMNAKKHRLPIEPFRWTAEDPLANEHQLVSELIAAYQKTGLSIWMEVDLDATETGSKIAEAEGQEACRFILSLTAYASHGDALAAKVKALAETEMDRLNWHHTPEWEAIWIPRMIASGALKRLMRRKLPLGSDHLIKLGDWIASGDNLVDSLYPLKAFTKAVQNHGEIAPGDAALRSTLSRVATALRNSHNKDLPKLAQIIETLVG